MYEVQSPIYSTPELDEAERDRQWRSTLTGAQYRWDDTKGWEVKTAAADWHPTYQGQQLPHRKVVGYSAEQFEEVIPDETVSSPEPQS